MNKKIFFQGDSITDAGRNKKDNHFLSGYSEKVSYYLGNSFEYVNYGLSGNTSRHVLVRHRSEFEKEMPDFLVYMIGINDVWRHFDGHDSDAVSEEECISNIIKVLKISKEVNKKVKTIFIEPYFIAGQIPALINATEMFKSYLSKIRQIIPKYVDNYVYTYEEFLKETQEGRPISYDGVHPNEYGQEKIALKIADAINFLNKIK